MIGTKFYKPLELDRLTRTVTRTYEREVQERVPVLDDAGNTIDYKIVTKTVTEEVPEQEEYDNPAQNTLSRYREAAQWCNENRAYIKDKGDYYEVVAIPEPTAEELAAAALAQAKAERAALVEKATVTVDGMVFDADETSQNRLSRGITAALALGLGPDETTEWTLADNSSAQVTVQQMARALLAAGQYQTSVWRMPYES